jgi:hypothetical protein
VLPLRVYCCDLARGHGWGFYIVYWLRLIKSGVRGGNLFKLSTLENRYGESLDGECGMVLVGRWFILVELLSSCH